MKKIIVNGAFGKMGHLACLHIEKAGELTLCAKVGSKDNLVQAIRQHKPDIVVELTTADVVWRNTKIIIDEGVHPIIGSSGLQVEQIQHVRSILKQRKQGGLIVPNFSIGAVLMMQCAEMAAQYFKDCSIVEMHHPAKIDKPSATAQSTAQRINQQNQQNVEIHSIRIPGVIARQQITFGGLDETLSIEHNTISREAFMPGILLACNKVMELRELMVGLEHCLK